MRKYLAAGLLAAGLALTLCACGGAQTAEPAPEEAEEAVTAQQVDPAPAEPQTQEEAAPEEPVVTETAVQPTLGQKNAVKKAQTYLKFSGFSKQGLVEQLKYEGFTEEEAAYGAENCGADWKEQAVVKANAYMKVMSYSRQGLIDQLKYEGFTEEEAEYGATGVGY